jgi:hypothetical protein
MHSATTGRFITSDYYMKDYPGWWKAFYESKPQNKYFGQTWSLLLPEEAYARSVSDDHLGRRNTRISARAFRIPSSAVPRSPAKPIMMQ